RCGQVCAVDGRPRTSNVRSARPTAQSGTAHRVVPDMGRLPDASHTLSIKRIRVKPLLRWTALASTSSAPARDNGVFLCGIRIFSAKRAYEVWRCGHIRYLASFQESSPVYPLSALIFMVLERCTAVTLSDEVFQALVKAILSGEVEPGARLDEPSICRKFGVSRTPIREALRRLSGTGLVEVTPRKGVTVARIDVEQLNNMFEALGEFEGLCAKLSAV